MPGHIGYFWAWHSDACESTCAQVHCENADLLVDAQTKTFEAGFTGPEGHYISRPAVIEVPSFTMHWQPVEPAMRRSPPREPWMHAVIQQLQGAC